MKHKISIQMDVTKAITLMSPNLPQNADEKQK